MDLELEKKSFPWKHLALYVIEFGFLLNIVFLDVIITKTVFLAPAKNQAASVERIEKTVYITPTPLPANTITVTPVPTSSVTISQPRQTVSSPQVKEYFVPLGTGQTASGDWIDVPGVQAYVDSTNYPNIKHAVFEVTVHIPSATESVQIRLFNATDKHPVWYSDVNYSGNTTQLLTSQPITLDSGNKLYTVQMKTQLQATAVVDQARIHITLQ